MEDDVKISATVIPAVIYQLAMRNEMVRRFDKADMPPIPKSPEPRLLSRAPPARGGHL